MATRREKIDKQTTVRKRENGERTRAKGSGENLYKLTSSGWNGIHRMKVRLVRKTKDINQV